MNHPWIVESREQPWGDYGEILAFGMTRHLPRTDAGELQLERTGPFVPPVFMSGIDDLLVRGPYRRAMEDLGFAGIEFRAVELARIVELDWQGWDADDDEPAEYPDSGAPEDYILERPHDPDLTAGIGPVWEVVIPNWRGAEGADLVRGLPDTGCIYASDRAGQWLKEVAAPWIEVVPNPRLE